MLRWTAYGLIALMVGVCPGALAAEKQVPDTAAAVQFSFAPIVKRVAPAVVNVYASRVVEQQSSPFFSDPFFGRLFGDLGGGPPSQRIQRSLGSGVIIDPSGLIVTNFHVIASADQVKVALSDKREFSAEVVLKDRRSDIAVLRIAGAGNLPTIPFADSDKVEVGDLVLAIGDPFGVGQTVTSGIVSAFAHVPGSQAEDQYFIQTDAAINPGNSGGALVDMSGHLVGINRMIVTPSGGSTGIGFAVPSNLVRVVVQAAATGGAPRRPWLGATLQPVTAEVAQAMSLASPRGVLVANVDPNGPAATARLKSGDLIMSIDGEAVEDPGALNYRLATKGIGGSAKLGVVRDGKPYTAVIDLKAAPETTPRAEARIAGNSPLTGVTAINLSPAVADELLYSGEPKGVIVSDVQGNSPAGMAGLKRGDVILDVNGVKIDTTARLAETTGKRSNVWQITISRDGQVVRMQYRG